MNHKKTKKEKKRLFMITLVMLGLLTLLFCSVYQNFVQIIDDKNAISLLENEYETLLSDEEELEDRYEKMQDPDYIERYAKEKYMYSSDDETIIRID